MSTHKSDKPRINFIIDLAMLIVFAALIGVGLLIKFTLIPGQERWLVFGRNFELTFWGLDRHEWGSIHLILGGLFFILFILHIVFHWNIIKCLFRKYIPSGALRTFTVVSSLLLSVVLILFPFFVKPERESIFRGEGRINLENMDLNLNDSIRVNLKKPKKFSHDKKLEMQIEEQQRGEETGKKSRLKEHEIHGSMSLDEIAEHYSIQPGSLRKELGIPPQISGKEKMGRLKRRYGFTMEELRETVQTLQDDSQ